VTRDSSAGEHGSSPEGDPLIFVSDASAEAERVTAVLRARGYRVADVPLGLLVSRVAVQRPTLIVCDVDAADALDTIARLREVPGSGEIDVLFLGTPERTLDERADLVNHEGSGNFYRPVDVDSVLRKVEALAGPPRARGDTRSSFPAHRSPVLVASTRKPYRYEGVSSRARNSSQPAAPDSAAGEPHSAPEPAAASQPGGASGDIGHGASLQGVLDGPAPKRVIPQSSLSPELQKLLLDAEHRLSGSAGWSLPPPPRMAPEEEVEAVLPAEVLAALDEPLELQDDDDFGSQVGGTRSGGERRGSEIPLASALAASDGARSGLSPEADLASTTPPRRGESPETSPNRGLQDAAPITPRAARHHVGPSSVPPSLPSEQMANTGGFSSVRPPSGIPNPPSGPGTEMQSIPPPQSVGQSAAGGDRTGAGQSAAGGDRTGAGQPAAGGDRTGAGQSTAGGDRTGTPATRSTTPPRAQHRVSDVPVAPPEIPSVLAEGDALQVLARLIVGRASGGLVVEDKSGMRRAVLRDGDFVTAVSGIEGESLVAFLAQRGDLNADALTRLGRTLPQFGRHAGAALVARGYLKQDDLWTVLRAHAEWVLVRIARVQSGAANFETTLPERLRSEPGVFGGATGAEVVLEVARRALPPQEAKARLGGSRARLTPGEARHLVGECALADAEAELIRSIEAIDVGDFLDRAGGDEFAPTLLALVELGILTCSASAARAVAAPEVRADVDAIDDDAVRARIEARRRLVEEADYFALLGVSRSATGYDVRNGYLTLRREFEPGRILTARTADLVDDVSTINQVLDEAYEILRDEARRERYRRALGE
jgi:hypothetical protein